MIQALEEHHADIYQKNNQGNSSNLFNRFQNYFIKV